MNDSIIISIKGWRIVVSLREGITRMTRVHTTHDQMVVLHSDMFVHRAVQGEDDCRALRLLHWTALMPPWKCGELFGRI